MELGKQSVPSGESIGDLTVLDNYEWDLKTLENELDLDGYSEARHGNPHFYLTTYRNTAMIQASVSLHYFRQLYWTFLIMKSIE